MKRVLEIARQRLYGAVDLGLDFATLGAYGLERVEPTENGKKKAAPVDRSGFFSV